MIESVRETMENYKIAYGQINETYLQAKDYIDKNYVEGSQMYNSTLGTAQNVRSEALEPLRRGCIEEVENTLQSVQNALKEVVLKPIPPDALTLIPLVSKMTEAEQRIVLDAYKDNYMATKMLYKELGMSFSNHKVENILETMEKIVNHVKDVYLGSTTPDNSYYTRLLMHGAYLGELDTNITEFINTYGVKADQKGGE